MMKRLIIAGGLLLASLGAATAPAAAQPYTAYVATGLNLRSGPGTEYPPVVVLPAGTPVTVHGCLEGWSWCDVSVGEWRGWVAGRYLTYEQLGTRIPVVQVAPTIGLPVISFSLGTYWDSYYRTRPWYRDRDRWVTHYSARPGYPGYRPPPVHYRPPAYRPPPRDHVHGRPAYNPPRRDWDRDRNRNDWNRGDRRSDNYAPPHRRDEPRRAPPPQRYGGGPGPGTSADERAAARFNRQRRGAMPGE